MSTPASAEELLEHIVAWGERIEKYVDGLSFSGFAADTMVQDAVIRCLEVIGEASGNLIRLHPSIAETHPDLPLAAAYRARNRTAHGYGSVNLQSVWTSATVSAPALVSEVRRVLAEPRS